nr:glutamate receptor 2-like [Procambarus clarkii]
MSGGVFTQTVPRGKVIDFSLPLYVSDLAIGYMRPQLEPDIAGFIKPFTLLVWLLLLVAVGTVIICIWFFQYQHARLSTVPSRRCDQLCSGGGSVPLGDASGPGDDAQGPGDDAQGPGDDTPGPGDDAGGQAFLWTLAATLSQGSTWWPVAATVRVLTGTWLLMAFVLGSVYRSNLMAMLTLPILQLPFNSLEELVQTNIKVFTVPDNFLASAIQEARPGTLLQRLQKQQVINKDIEGAKVKITLGQLAFFTNRPTLEALIDTITAKSKKCSHYIAKGSYFGSSSLSLAFPKGSPLKQKIDPLVRGLRDFGILDYLYRKSLPFLTRCEKEDPVNGLHNQLRPLQLNDFYGVFIVYLVGMFLGLLAFLLELACRTLIE